MQPQTVQILAAVAVWCAFAVAEMAQGRFLPREATRQDNRLDIAVTPLFPLIATTPSTTR